MGHILRVVFFGVALLGLCGAAPQTPAVNTSVVVPPISGASAVGSPVVRVPVRSEVQQRLDALPETETAARDALREALAFLDRHAQALERAAESQQRIEEAPRLLESIRAELEGPAVVLKPEVPEGATLSQIDQAAQQAAAQLDAARALVLELQTEGTRRQERRTQIPELLAAANKRLKAIEDDLSSAGGAVVAPGDSGATGETPVVAAERTPLMDARSIRLDAEYAALVAEVAAFQKELDAIEARREVLPARRDRAARRVTQAEKLAEDWRAIASAKRRQDAEREAADAARMQREVARRDPVLQSFAEITQRLAEERVGPTGTPAKITAAKAAAQTAEAELADIRKQYTDVQKRIEVGGLTRATGLLLRRHFDALKEGMTNLSRLRRRLNDVRRELELTEVSRIERDDDRAAAGAIDSVVAGLMSEIESGDTPADELPALEAAARELAVARRDLLGRLENDATEYSVALVRLEEDLTNLLAAVEAYDGFIRERILWVRSVPRRDAPGLAELQDSFERITDPSAWRVSVEATGKEIRTRWALLLITGAGVLMLFVLRIWARRRMRTIADRVARFRTDSFHLTLIAEGLTLLISLPVGCFLIWVGSLLARTPGQSIPGLAVGSGLREAGLVLIVLSAVFGIFRRGGLAEAHFRWSVPLVKQVRRLRRWFVPLAVVSVGVLSVSDVIGTEASDGTIGRLAFSALVFGVFIAGFLFVRSGGPLAVAVERHGGWPYRLRLLWMPLGAMFPLAMLVITWLGYFYTARQLGVRFEITLMVTVVLVLVNAMLLRWLFVARRKVAVDDAKRRREQAIAAAATAAERSAGEPAKSDIPSEGVVAVIDEDKLDLPAISQQTQQLFRVGILVAAVVGAYVAWADVLPALRMLERVQVYPSFAVTEQVGRDQVPILEGELPRGSAGGDAAGDGGGSGSGASGNGAGGGSAKPTGAGASGGGSEGSRPGFAPVGSGPSSGSVSGPVSGADAGDAESGVTVVTLVDVLLGLVLLAATGVAFRNVPGLVEIVVLQRLPLDAGSRFALSTVLRYAIAIVGVVAAFGAMHISWSNLQWLAAALTFGLGFGLQEIFANFVSGLIILGERPIRIGDTVTVGSVTGTVTRIKMRATTITDWDRKELIIPNKSFITGEVINWTLSDPLLRLRIPVGVSYGADVRLAETVLKQVASEAKNVLAEPKAFVIFNGFGDSTLDFELRVFIPHVEHLIAVRHDLHMRIIEAFRAHKLEIAFPQRDLHIRSFEGLDRLARSATPGPAGDGAAGEAGPTV